MGRNKVLWDILQREVDGCSNEAGGCNRCHSLEKCIKTWDQLPNPKYRLPDKEFYAMLSIVTFNRMVQGLQRDGEHPPHP